ncbi:hypothetical protein ACSU1N_00490 [Thermogladius sp. 4427co]|uniref:hypothetical protein n=1 Tax=Thermogladius sp. 4427co TaxID=3450718 RepID=UPI003F793D19
MTLEDPRERRELVDLIIQAGLEEDFLNWLRIQGITHVVGKFDNVPIELIRAYVEEKKLYPPDKVEEGIADNTEFDQRYIPSREGGRVKRIV